MDFPLQSVRVGKNVCGLVRRGLVIDATAYRCIIRAANEVTNFFNQQIPDSPFHQFIKYDPNVPGHCDPVRLVRVRSERRR